MKSDSSHRSYGGIGLVKGADTVIKENEIYVSI